MKYIAMLLITLMVSACGKAAKTYIKHEVDAVYWHEHAKYTVAIIQGDNVEMRQLPFMVRVSLVTDLGEGQKSWYECSLNYSEWSGHSKDSWCRIHIRSLGDLQTAGWNHGKFGSGSTTRID